MATASFPYKLKSHPNRLLKDHILGVHQIALRRFSQCRISFPNFNRKDLRKILEIASLFHDFGKSTPWFQRYIADPDSPPSAKERNLRSHGLISSFMTFAILTEELSDNLLPAVFGFIIVRRHHGNLEAYRNLLTVTEADVEICRQQVEKIDYAEYREIVRPKGFEEHTRADFLQSILESVSNGQYKNFRTFKRLDRNFSVQHYFVLNLMYSLLIEADKSDALFHGDLVTESAILESHQIHEFRSNFKDQLGNPIFQIRNEIFEAVDEAIERIDDRERLFSINTPTGSGKTITALNAALRIREKFRYERVIYCLPFTSVIDQNFFVFDCIREDTGLVDDSGMLLKHHHLVDITYRSVQEDDVIKEYKPDKAFHLIEGWESRIIVSTFVQFLYSLISRRNASLRKFNKFSNAVIILDEVQNIEHEYWLLIREMLKHLAEWLDSRIILVTATMPLIFSEQKGEIKELVENKEEMYRRLSRLDLNVSRIADDCIDWETFCCSIKALILSNRNKDILIVLNTIRSSRELYIFLKENRIPHRLMYLSSHVIPKQRLGRIVQIKNRKKDKPCLVVSTQLVEAGVDIDLDLVIRDFAPLDSIFQTCGRCNRENRSEMKGQVILFSIKDSNGWIPAKIYDSFLLEKTKKVIGSRSLIPESDFYELAQRYYSEVAELGSQRISRNVLERIRKLEYTMEDGESFAYQFKLIHDDFCASVFVEFDQKAERVWKHYLEIVQMERGFRKMALLRQVRRDLAEYIINVPRQLIPLRDEDGIYHLNKERVADHYDRHFGFKADIELPEEEDRSFIF